jgi:hypothetical protein
VERRRKLLAVKSAMIVPSRNIRYYVDLTLVPVVLVSLFLFCGSLWHWPPAIWNWREGMIGVVVLGGALLLAKERRLVLAAAFGYIAAQSVFGISVSRTATQVAGFVAIGGMAALAAIGIGWTLRKRRTFYGDESSRIDVVVSALVFGTMAVFLFLIMRDTVRFYLR